ncbi:MAG: ABC transporter permease subunit [Clostridia bacterium]|nr:ABC transporter permease subunit [Clostridia bacterium]
MLAIYKREMRAYFTGAIGYVFLVIFLSMGGALFSYTNLYSMKVDVSTYYLWMLIFSAVVLPMLTMKSFSEEKKAKTEQLLMTSPVSIPGMVFGKFLAAYSMFAGALLVTTLPFLIVTRYAVVPWALLLGNLIALLLVGLMFIAIGLFVSSLTENQLAAVIGTVAILAGLLGIGVINSLLPSKYWLRYVFNCLSVFTRFQTFTNGYFDLSSLIYYLSVSGIFLYLTMRVYDRRRYL